MTDLLAVHHGGRSPTKVRLLTQEPQQGLPHVQTLLQLQAWWMSYPPADREATSEGQLASWDLWNESVGSRSRVVQLSTPFRCCFRCMRL